MNKKDKLSVIRKLAEFLTGELNAVHEKLNDLIRDTVKILGNKVCLRWYHDEAETDRYTFFEVDDNGYGVELFITGIAIDEEDGLTITLEDSEQTVEYERELDDFSVSEALDILNELFSITDYNAESGIKTVVDVDEDMNPIYAE